MPRAPSRAPRRGRSPCASATSGRRSGTRCSSRRRRRSAAAGRAGRRWRPGAATPARRCRRRAVPSPTPRPPRSVQRAVWSVHTATRLAAAAKYRASYAIVTLCFQTFRATPRSTTSHRECLPLTRSPFVRQRGCHDAQTTRARTVVTRVRAHSKIVSSCSWRSAPRRMKHSSRDRLAGASALRSVFTLVLRARCQVGPGAGGAPRTVTRRRDRWTPEHVL